MPCVTLKFHLAETLNQKNVSLLLIDRKIVDPNLHAHTWLLIKITCCKCDFVPWSTVILNWLPADDFTGTALIFYFTCVFFISLSTINDTYVVFTLVKKSSTDLVFFQG